MTFTAEPSIRLSGSWAAWVENAVMVTEEGGVPFSNYRSSPHVTEPMSKS